MTIEKINNALKLPKKLIADGVEVHIREWKPTVSVGRNGLVDVEIIGFIKTEENQQVVGLNEMV